jgi:glutathione S-transferase
LLFERGVRRVACVSSARKLISLRVSPWSERAKWALDHHGLEYEVVEHQPVLGERRLRRIVGARKAKATVPVLVADGDVFPDSWDIALYADRVGRGTRLVPDEHRPAIEAWLSKVEDAMSAGRALSVGAMLESPEALDAAAVVFPRWLRPAMRPVTRRVTRMFANKYGLRFDQREANEEKVRVGLRELRARLGGKAYMLGAFSYADILATSMVQGISPVSDRFVPFDPATRKAWTKETLAAEFADLVAWRDGVYEKHRKKK